ncbi:hypothetical protein [Kitasatospora griseola]|uniref:hypothetical protein n=1 Tax=Kitasatospora griseola TaxID=2064 RepID=UPI0034369F41
MDRPPQAVYFDAQAEARLERAWTVVGIGFAVSLLPGLATTRRYDRKGLHRAPRTRTATRPDRLTGRKGLGPHRSW